MHIVLKRALKSNFKGLNLGIDIFLVSIFWSSYVYLKKKKSLEK